MLTRIKAQTTDNGGSNSKSLVKTDRRIRTAEDSQQSLLSSPAPQLLEPLAPQIDVPLRGLTRLLLERLQTSTASENPSPNEMKKPTGWQGALLARIAALPPTIRPVAYGVLLVNVYMLWRGGLFVLPVALIVLLVATPHGWVAVLTFLEAMGMAMAGGALSGLGYGLVGRHIRNAFPGGRYVAGVLTIAPYMFVLIYIERVFDHVSFMQPYDPDNLVVIGGLTVLFGCVIGHSWFAPRKILHDRDLKASIPAKPKAD